MKIGFGCDHAGLEMKEYLMKYLEKQGHEIYDYAPLLPGEKIDYPFPAAAVGDAITEGKIDCGILVCGTGIGMSIAANKVPGIRAAHVSDPYSARLTKQHNNAQIICLGGRVIGLELAKDIVDAYLGAEYEGGRHQKRLDLITMMEESWKD